MRITASDEHIELEDADLPPSVILSWPGWRKHSEGVYQAPLWTTSLQPLSTFRQLPEKLAGRLRDLEAGKLALHLSSSPSDMMVGNRQLMPHQRAAVLAFLSMQQRVLLADDMGLGKTTEALAMTKHCKAVLILCPKGLRPNWRREIMECYPDHEHVFTVDGTPKKRLEIIRAATASSVDRRHTTYLIAHYDLLPRASDEMMDGLVYFLADHITFKTAIICDESHALKSKDAKRTKRVMDLVDRAQPSARILATGTPIRNMVDDLWSQVEILRPGTWTSYTDFERRHCHVGFMEVNVNGRIISQRKIMGSKNLGELNETLKHFQIRRHKGEVLDLPKVSYNFPVLELDETSRIFYRDMREEARLALSLMDPTANIFDPKAKSALDQAMKCGQICQGLVAGASDTDLPEIVEAAVGRKVEGVKRGAHTDYVVTDNVKLRWILDSLTEISEQGSQAVVFGNYNSLLRWMHKELTDGQRVSSGLIYGDVGSEERQRTIDAFNAGELRVLFSQVSIAEGWNATAAQHAFFIGRSWSPAVNQQAVDRIHRIGQEKPVTVHIPLVENTIEMCINKRLEKKAGQASAALDVKVSDLLMEL